MEKERLYKFAIEGMKARINECRKTSEKALALREEKRYCIDHKCKLSLEELTEISRKVQAEIVELEAACFDLEWELATEE